MSSLMQQHWTYAAIHSAAYERGKKPSSSAEVITFAKQLSSGNVTFSRGKLAKAENVVDTESLQVLSAFGQWKIRVEIYILRTGIEELPLILCRVIGDNSCFLTR